MMPTCGEVLCDQVRVTECRRGDKTCEADELTLETPAAMQCTLEALRDRTPGFITWTLDAVISVRYGYILINEDGSVVSRTWGFDDLAFQAQDANLGQLPPEPHYTDCLLEEDARDQLTCMLSLESVDAVCDEGWRGEEF